MMDDFERELATLIRSAVPAPPVEIDPAEITRNARPRTARAVVAPLLTALLVAAVVVAVFSLVRGGRSDNTTPPTSAAGAMRSISPPISADQTVILTPRLTLLAIDEHGATVRRLGMVRMRLGAEVDALDVSGDGRHVIVSIVNDHDRACSATVYSLGDDGRLHRLFRGGAATFSPDGARVAYLQYTRSGEFCYRTRLAITNLGDGSKVVLPLVGGRTLEGNPPEWPLNWSPDGTELAYVGKHGIALATTADGHRYVQRIVTADGRLAPVFTRNDALAVYTGCCSGNAQQVTAISLSGKPATTLFPLNSPVRSIRSDRGGHGLWLTTEESPNTLWHWDGTRLRPLPVQALIASG
jgi:hypothetical protein